MKMALAIGTPVVVGECRHFDVKRNTPGIVTSIELNGGSYFGYGVQVRTRFAVDVDAKQMEVRTETVFVEAQHVQKVMK